MAAALGSVSSGFGCIWRYEAGNFSSMRRCASNFRVKGSLASAPGRSQSAKAALKRKSENSALLLPEKALIQNSFQLKVPEIEQGLSDVSRSKVTNRGMQSTIYVVMSRGVTANDLNHHLRATYEDEEFIKVLENGVIPQTRNVRGSNYCFMNVFEDRIPGRAIIISVIDNLVKGASGQAVHNLNLMM